MKAIWPIAAAASLAACSPGTDPSPSSTYRPHGASNVDQPGTPRFDAGQFVRALIDNVSFFRQLPMGEARVDMFLPKHTPMRVIEPGASYAKVELDNGEIGYVLSAMLEPISMPGQTPSLVTPPSIDTAPPHSPGGAPERIDPQWVVPE